MPRHLQMQEKRPDRVSGRAVNAYFRTAWESTWRYYLPGRTVSTGMGELLTTFSATEPKRMRSMPVRP